ncbi:monooxygenase [Achromobacter xylosoxidans]|uniref:FAD-dependent oxidoreductase n=1 Tax=Alcaligenes xylosoxydans xylosoxydans TaxID=85698 RepID=UPI00064D9943|nr:FAD-dependent monooxygenase [Achromobacter xylosoxidans]KMJ91421.1 monooxygenase [Achromobacter xylosoxidans]
MDIGILGGGIAGLSVALALHRTGHRPRVYERGAAPATMGAGVTLWPNAAFVLDALGLLPDVAAAGGRPRAMRRYDNAGHALGSLDISALDRLMGYPTHTILRRDLLAVLLAHAARAGIPVEYGHRAVAIEPDADGRAAARFENGAVVRADLLVGADGRMDSVARRFVVGDNTPVYQGFVNWIGIASGPGLAEDMAIQDYWGVGERFGCVAVRPDLVYWAGAEARPLAAAVQGPDPRAEVADRFAGWADPIARLIQATPADAVRLIAVHDLDTPAAWHRANMLLVGDAAHAPLPTSGQGACQALEDAWHLARCLAGAPRDLDAALSAFTALRQPKTAALTEQARVYARGLFERDPQACRLRDQQIKAVDAGAALRAMASAWGQGLACGGGGERG